MTLRSPVPPLEGGGTSSDPAVTGVKLFAICVGVIATGALLWMFGPRFLADNLSFVFVWGGFAGASLVAFVFRGCIDAWDKERRPKTPEELLREFERVDRLHSEAGRGEGVADYRSAVFSRRGGRVYLFLPHSIVGCGRPSTREEPQMESIRISEVSRP